MSRAVCLQPPNSRHLGHHFAPILYKKSGVISGAWVSSKSLEFCTWGLCHEHHRSKRRCGTVREMKEGPSGSAIRSLIPSHRKLLWSKVTVVSVAETPGR